MSAETYEMRKLLATLPLAKPRYNAGEIFKTYELFIYGDKPCLTNSFS